MDYEEEMQQRDIAAIRELWVEELEERIGERHASASFDSMMITEENAAIIKHCSSWVDGFGPGVPGLHIHGPSSSGKTHITAAAAKEVCRRGNRVLWLNVTGYLDRLRHNMKGSQVAMQPRQLVQTARLVVLDDFGVDKPTDWVVERLYELVDGLYTSNTTLISTSNDPFNVLHEKYGERIVARMNEMTDPLLLEGDMRKAIAQKRRAS